MTHSILAREFREIADTLWRRGDMLGSSKAHAHAVVLEATAEGKNSENHVEGTAQTKARDFFNGCR